MLSATGIGTVLQILMVVIGHLVPVLQERGLFPIAGTLIGAITGWLAGRATAGGMGAKAGSGALGDVPLANIAIAGGSTLVTGAIGAALSALGRR